MGKLMVQIECSSCYQRHVYSNIQNVRYTDIALQEVFENAPFDSLCCLARVIAESLLSTASVAHFG